MTITLQKCNCCLSWIVPYLAMLWSHIPNYMADTNILTHVTAFTCLDRVWLFGGAVCTLWDWKDEGSEGKNIL